MAGLGRILLIPLGLAVGAGGGGAVAFLAPSTAAERAPVEAGDGRFVTLGALLVPVTLEDGQLSGFVHVEPQLEVADADQEAVKARLPLVIHAINVRLYRTPLATGVDGRLPDAGKIRNVVAEEAGKILGRSAVRSVALTRIAPA